MKRILLILSLAGLFACATSAESTRGDDTVVGVAAADGRFTKLVAAIQAAGLVDTLSGQGPYTVFAPTDAAFEKLPEEALAELMAPAGKEKLGMLLKHHVVPDRVTAEDVLGLNEAVTVAGTTVAIESTNADVTTIGGARITVTDIEASNGVIHVIDTVLMPADL